MNFFPKRSERSRLIKFKGSKLKLLLIANLWLIYLIFLSMNFMTHNTYSYFSDEEKIENTFSTAINFCADKDFRKNHKGDCKCKDNSGLGNGSEECDEYEYVKGDEDNPGHQNQYCPDNPNTPEIEVCDDQNNGKGNTNSKNLSKPNSSNEQSPGTNDSGTSP